MKGLYTLVSFPRELREIVKTLPNGQPVTLIRENHPKDKNAVQIWANGQMIGYLKAIENPPVAMAMDAALGRVFHAKLVAVPAGTWPLVDIDE